MTHFRSRAPLPAAGAAFALLLALAPAPAAAAQETPNYYGADAIFLFARSLYDEADYQRAAQEFLRALFLGRGGDREVLYLVAKCNQLSGERQKAQEGFQRIVSVGMTDEWNTRSLYELAITDALLGSHERSLTLLRDSSLPTLSDAFEPFLLQGWNLILAHDWAGADEALALSPSALADDLKALTRQAKIMPRRSPVLAGLLSAILPGAGKLYADRPSDALFSLALVGSLATLSGLGFAEEGVGSVRGWTYGSLALLFHAGNIYGAVVAAGQYNQASEGRIESQALVFYDANLR